jgi:hypothetical protein
MKSCSKRIETLCLEKIGNSELKIFIEKQDSSCKFLKKTEFIFEINSSTKKQVHLPLKQAHRVIHCVAETLNNYIQNVVFKELEYLLGYQITIEIEGNNQKEIEMKHILYDNYLDRLAKKFNEVVDEIFCVHSKNNLTHYLTFSHTTTA